MKTNTKYSNIAMKLILSSLMLVGLTINNTFAEELPGLIGYWNFDQCSVLDSTQIQSNGTTYGTPTCVDGIKGKAFRFGGVYDRDYIVVGNTSELRINNNFTFNMWFNIQGDLSMDGRGSITNYGGQIILAKAGDRNGINIGLGRQIDGKWYLGASNGRCCTTDNKGISGKTGMGLNEWHMMSFSHGGGYARLYLDGKLESELTEAEFMLNPDMINQDLQIAIGQWAYRYPFNGIADELKIYNRALDGNEVKSLYTGLTKPSSPTKLSQQIQSPELDPQEINPGEKIGKFQSGSGVIFVVDSNPNEATKLVVAIYKIGEEMPKIFLNSSSSTSTTKSITIPYSDLGAGDYFWKARLETDDGKASDWVNFGNNNPGETDYSLYEGFEPYPYGYSFVNSHPDYTLLTGSLSGLEMLGFDNRKKIDGSKWQIMDKVFPESSFSGGKREYYDAFEFMGLVNEKPNIFNNGNCFGLSLSALTQKYYPEKIQKNFPEFSNNIGNGFVWDEIKIQSYQDNGNTWLGLDNNIKAILSYQLYQYEKKYSEKNNLSLNNDTPVSVLNKIKNNPDKTYLLTFQGRDGCNIFGFDCDFEPSHTVVPYKVEGNKIYIWDNNAPYPFYENNRGQKIKAYDSFIEINSQNNTFNVPGYEWDIFDGIGIVAINDVYSNSTSPIGFNNTDSLYTLSGNSDMLLIDNIGRKTGYKDGKIFKEVPGVNILKISNTSSGTQNQWKQIYIPQKIDGLTIKVSGKSDEKYNLMVAGGDYYTKVSGVNINTGQTDAYITTNTGLLIDFDDTKIGTYSLLTDNFQDTLTGTIYLSGITSISQTQSYIFDWNKVKTNNNDSIQYQIDTDSDGIYDQISNFYAIPKVINEKGSISGYIKGDTNASMAGWKVFIDSNGDGILQENKEPFKITDNKGYYKFDNIEKGNYSILEIIHQNWNLIKPINSKYQINLNSGQNIINLNFENNFIKSKTK